MLLLAESMLSHLILSLGCVSISEPASVRHQHYSDGSSNSGKITVSINEGLKSEESKVLLVSSSRSERTETRVSSSANASRYFNRLSSFWSNLEAPTQIIAFIIRLKIQLLLNVGSRLWFISNFLWGKTITLTLSMVPSTCNWLWCTATAK